MSVTISGFEWPDWAWRGEDVLVHKSGRTVWRETFWFCEGPDGMLSSYPSTELHVAMARVENWAAMHNGGKTASNAPTEESKS